MNCIPSSFTPSTPNPSPTVVRRQGERNYKLRQLAWTLRKAARLADETYNLSPTRADRARIAQLNQSINQRLREVLAKIERGKSHNVGYP
jgi:hypothetical protein